MAIVNTPDYAGTEFEGDFINADFNEILDASILDESAPPSEETIREFYYTSVEPAPVTLPVDVLSINSAYAELATTRRQMAEAIEFEAMCQRVLNEREHALLLNGVIDGKNAELREAQMFNRTEPERAALLKAATKRRNAQLNLALATDAVQRLRTIVALITSQA